MSTSSAKTSPEFTPASTPSGDTVLQQAQQTTAVVRDAIMAETPNGIAHDPRDEVSATSTASPSRTLADSSAPANSASATEANTKLDADPPAPDSTKSTELKSTIVDKKDYQMRSVTTCKKHQDHEQNASNRKRVSHKAKKKCGKKAAAAAASSSSASSSSSSSNSDSEASDETANSSSGEESDDSHTEASSGTSSSSSDSDEGKRRAKQKKRKQKHKDKVKAKRNSKLKKTNRSREKQEESSDSSDTDEDKLAARKFAKRKGKKLRSKDESSEAHDPLDGNAVSGEMALLRTKEKLAALQLRLADGHLLKGQTAGKLSNADKKTASHKLNDKRQSKKKIASKVAFKRVDQCKSSFRLSQGHDHDYGRRTQIFILLTDLQ